MDYVNSIGAAIQHGSKDIISKKITKNLYS